VSVLQFHGGTKPGVNLLSDINAMGLVKRVVSQDSWLIVGSTGFEIYNVARPANPVKVSWTSVGINDLAVQDSFLYTASGDSFTVFNIADKASPRLVGFCSDSGSTIAVSHKYAFLLWGTFGWHGMYILDITNPAAPHRVGAWNSSVGHVAAQRSLCYVTDGTGFHILNVADPASPQELGSVGIGGGIYLDGDYAFISNFGVIDVSDSMMPGIVGQCSLEVSGDVWATGLYGEAFVACYSEGMGIIGLSDPMHPAIDSVGILAADDARDISVQGDHALIADDNDGLKMLNIADPTHPFEIASYDSEGLVPYCYAAKAAGTTAYMGWDGWDGWRGLYVITFADSTNPVLLGKAASLNPFDALAIRDSWAYASEYAWFQTISITESVHPSVAGTCSLGVDDAPDVCLSDSIAYVANKSGGLRVIDVAQPHNAVPTAIYMPQEGDAECVAVRDSLAYVGTSDGLRIVNVANPRSPAELGFYSSGWYDQGVQVNGNFAVIGNILWTLDISDPVNPRMAGFYVPPTQTFKICWVDSLIFATCLEGGVVIVKYTGPDACAEAPAAASRARPSLAIVPNPTTGVCRLSLNPGQAKTHELHLCDSNGRLIRILRQTDAGKEVIDLRDRPKGVYFIGFVDGDLDRWVKVVVIR
jgi:hypothetical protein